MAVYAVGVRRVRLDAAHRAAVAAPVLGVLAILLACCRERTGVDAPVGLVASADRMGLMYATARVPILLYFLLDSNADSVFFVCLFLALAAIWAPVLYGVSTFAPSLARVAVSGQYDFWRTRQARRVHAWPMMSMLFLLAVFVVITGALLSTAVSDMSAAAIALGLAGILLCIGLVMMATTMSAVAYREQAAEVAGAGD
ncbi:hypothetical protein G6F22_013401 [Rhizopus arrhizus]|nr:hypothetical protein G6F22_013401 [Rhizopus arrhizus]